VLALREERLAEERSRLTLLEAGSRPEEITAAAAHVDRLHKEQRYLERLQAKLPIYTQCPA
jgi:hypothetical protein